MNIRKQGTTFHPSSTADVDYSNQGLQHDNVISDKKIILHKKALKP